ncbi:GNAT family N-acetyltransferase [Nocardioides panacisoli]|uniref:GNAT family N-acetyltransferase n=1 Tax=Nocardioides panacisoli TaxID=627624 RepID=A0ABP7I4U6_9ACTN
MSGAAFAVGRVPIADTLALRAKVLRPGGPPESARVPGDDHPEAAAYAARDGGEIVGCVVLFPDPCPDLPGRAAGSWRIRGMATAIGWRGSGVGSAVLDAALAHVRAAGGDLVWCNARTPARTLYERAGFRQVGEEWIEGDFGLHVRMWCELAPDQPANLSV